MALDGGGGGGGPVGFANSFTGAAEALEIYGDFAAAYTGLYAATTTAFEVLSFTSGNYLFVGDLQLNGAVDDDSPADVTTTTANVSFNGVSVFILVTGDDVQRAAHSISQQIIIPPYTKVVVTLDNESIAADQYSSVVLTGRIYR